MAKYQSAFEKRFGKQGSGTSLAQRNADNAAFKRAKLRDKMSAATQAASGVGPAKPHQAPIKIKMPKREWSGETSNQLFARIDREMEAGKPPAGSRRFDAIKTTYGGDLGNKATRSADRARANAEMDPTIAATMTHQGRKTLPNYAAARLKKANELRAERAKNRWKLPGDELKASGHDAHTSAIVDDREHDQARYREKQRAKKTARKFDAIQDRRGYQIGREGDEFDKYDRVSAKDARQEFENDGKEMEEYDTFGAGRHGAGEGQYSPSGRSGGKGKGRGNWGHKGRPGKRGGSA